MEAAVDYVLTTNFAEAVAIDCTVEDPRRRPVWPRFRPADRKSYPSDPRHLVRSSSSTKF